MAPLHELGLQDGISPGSPDHLTTLLDVGKCGDPNPPAQDGLQVVGYLNDAPDALNPDRTAHLKCLPVLIRKYRTLRVVPESYALGAHLTISSHPVTSGPVADIYWGTLDGREVCVKRVRMYSEGGPWGIQEFCQEATIWGHMRHPNIVPFRGVTVTPPQLVSEWMSNGNITEYARKHPHADRLSLLLDVTEGLTYLHSNHVVHGDLKGPSILIDDTGRARITDFGLATITSDLGPTAPIYESYSVRWTAPEVLSGETGVTKEADVYSIGMVITEVFSGAAPFPGSAPPAVTAKVLLGERPGRPKDPGLTDTVWKLIRRCWEPDPRRRPNITEVFLGLRRALAVRQRDRADVVNITKTDDKTLGNRQHKFLFHVSPSTAPSDPAPAGLKGISVRARRHLGGRKSKKLIPEPWPASDATCTIKSSEPGHIPRLIELGGLGTHVVVKSTSSRSGGFLRRAGSRLLNRTASPTRNDHVRPNNPRKNQGYLPKFKRRTSRLESD